MDDGRFTSVGDLVLDENFPDVDIALRRGRHIDRDDGPWYALLTDGQAEFEILYRRFGCELVHKSDGFFYLLPTTDRLGKRQLSVAEMLVGQALALLLLDPCTVESGGLVARDEVLAHMARIMGPVGLMRALNPKKKRLDERVAEQNVRTRVSEALRRLASLGFVQPLEGDRIRLRSSLMRFAEPVRGGESPEQTLEQLVANGEIALGIPDDAESDDDTIPMDEDDESDTNSPDEQAPQPTDSELKSPDPSDEILGNIANGAEPGKPSSTTPDHAKPDPSASAPTTEQTSLGLFDDSNSERFPR